MTEYRVILSGNTPAAGEVWSCGMSLQGVAPAMDQSEITLWAQGVANAIEVVPTTGIYSLLSTTGTINKVRCELRDPDNEALLLAGEASLIPPKTGGGAAARVLQCSLVISHRTNIPGRSYRGRVYWPAWNFAGTAEMLFSTSSLPDLLTSYADLVELVVAQAVVVDPSFAMILVVRSRLLHLSTPVVALAAGNVPDTQRRRRDALTEQYTVLPV